MPRIRTLKPEFWQDEKLSPCDPLTRLVFLGLVSLADDAGRLVDNLRLIDAQIFPNTSDTAHEALMRLSGMGRIRRGITASGQRIIEIVNWNRHQKIQHPNLRGALPEIVEDQPVTVIHEALMNGSRGAHEPLTHHTNDQRPTTSTNDLTTSAPRAVAPAPLDGFAGDVLPAPAPVPRRAKAKPATARPEPLYPHFDKGLCDEMHGLWTTHVGAADYPRFRKAFAPLFGNPETRPADAPTDRELVRALKSFVDIAPSGPSAPFVSPEKAAGLLSAIVQIHRQFPENPEARVDATMRLIHGKIGRAAA